MVRIGGLASGMDTDTIVGDLMKAERIPLNKLHQKKQLLEWQRDDYRAMNKLLDDFDRFMFDGIMRKSTFTKKSITTSKPEEVAVRNISASSNMNTTIKVERLAEAAHMTSAGAIANNTQFDPNGLLKDQRVHLNAFTSNEFTIQSINKDGILSEAVTIKFNPDTDSLNAVIDKINNSTAGVIAFYDSISGQFSITAKNTGAISGGPEIVLAGDFLSGALKMQSQNSDLNDVLSPGSKAGVNAAFTINGISTQRSSNVFEINGFEYSLKGATNTAITVSSVTDEESVFQSVKAFVDKYNETISKINNELTEERFRKYQPLSDEEREDMTEKQAEMWDEKAKSGMLRNDSILGNALNKMRADLSGTVGKAGTIDGVNDLYDQLAEVGISTSKNWRDRGKLEISDTKLREAIKNDPNAIFNIFNHESSVTSEMGLAKRLRATIKETIGKIEERAGNTGRANHQFTLGRSLLSIDSRIDSFEDRLLNVENRYWRQFTAMEKAIQKANSQSAYLMQQFSY